jgi:hypothetical protein
MLVYGDRRRTATASTLSTQIEAILEAAERTAGLERHDLLTRALIEAGELAQGLADAELDAMGFDDVSPAQDAAMALAIAVARQLHASWRSGHRESAATPGQELAAVRALRDHAICLKAPEGYAFYAVYPDHYLAAAASYPWRQPPLVIGLRSIGTSLAAAVAAATGGVAISLRPVGHPFRREVRVSAAVKSRLAAHCGPFAIVDEGPGLSGSSFGAVSDLLATLGVEDSRLVFLPSHHGAPGPQASPRHRARWTQVRKLVAAFDDASAAETMQDWFGEGVRPLSCFEDLSGGAWRAERRADRLPPVAAGQERRKYRWRAGAERHLARFVGLGSHGQAKLLRAETLHRAGFGPEPLGLRRGFLLERWIEGLRLEPSGSERGQFLRHLGRYLGFRARAFPASAEEGASLGELRHMAEVNAAELCGEEVSARVKAQLARLDDLQDRLAPVHVDGRLHRWEWVGLGNGDFCKADSLDHSCDHGLVGCQDIAWDIAGAAVEFRLSAHETSGLQAIVAEASGRATPPDAVRMFGVCYAAFQAAAWAMAEQTAAPIERRRIRCWRSRYESVLGTSSLGLAREEDPLFYFKRGGFEPGDEPSFGP